jgi:hypothetical protein
MIDLKTSVNEYITLIEQGDYLEAIDRFYDDKIVQIENTNEPLIGKSTLRDNEIKNLDNVHSVEIKTQRVVVDEEQGLVLGEMLMHFDSKKTGRRKLAEAFVQQWQDGKIIEQRFYYKGFQDDN